MWNYDFLDNNVIYSRFERTLKPTVTILLICATSYKFCKQNTLFCWRHLAWMLGSQPVTPKRLSITHWDFFPPSHTVINLPVYFKHAKNPCSLFFKHNIHSFKYHYEKVSISLRKSINYINNLQSMLRRKVFSYGSWSSFRPSRLWSSGEWSQGTQCCQYSTPEIIRSVVVTRLHFACDSIWKA